MGRAPCCDKANVKKGPWSPEEDAKLKEYIEKNGTGGNWIALPQKVGLRRCGKSCRLRWLNYLRPNIKHGEFSEEEDRVICSLFATIGSRTQICRWSIIAAQLPGRTDNDIKNYWNTKLKKKLMGMAPSTHYLKRPNQSTNLYPLPSNTSFLPNSSSSSSSMASPYSSLYSHEHGNTTFSRVYEPNFNSLNSSAFNGLVNPAHGSFNQASKESRNNLLIYGGEASCSSSDGSCITNQMSHVKEVETDYGNFSNGDQNLCFQGYFTNGVDDENQKFLFTTTDGLYSSISSSSSATATAAAASYGCFSENPQGYYSVIEEIKELISTNNNMCNNNLNFFVDDMIKTEEKMLDY